MINSDGKVIETINGGDINGPWDMTAYDGGKTGDLFVSNVLNGTVAGKGKGVAKGTIVRVALDFSVAAASHARESSSPVVLTKRPTGRSGPGPDRRRVVRLTGPST